MTGEERLRMTGEEWLGTTGGKWVGTTGERLGMTENGQLFLSKALMKPQSFSPQKAEPFAGTPVRLHILGGSEFRLRQGFALRQNAWTA